jgi:hypothetical protein
MFKQIVILFFITLSNTHACHIPEVSQLMHSLTIELGDAYTIKHRNAYGPTSTKAWDDEGCLICFKLDDYADLQCGSRSCGRGCHETCLQRFWKTLTEKGCALKGDEHFTCPFCYVRFNRESDMTTDFLLVAAELFQNSFPAEIASLKHIFSTALLRDEDETVAACKMLLWVTEKKIDDYLNESYWNEKSIVAWASNVSEKQTDEQLKIKND